MISTQNTETWQAHHTIETAATPDAIWRVFRDVPGWKRWNHGIEHVEIDGPFAIGSWLTMKPPGDDTLRTQLIEVRENDKFVDETRVGDIVVTVEHVIEPVSASRTRVRYGIAVAGPGAAHVGPAISSDFPDVLAALARLVEA